MAMIVVMFVFMIIFMFMMQMREAIRFGNEHGHEEVEDLAKCSKPFIFSLMILIKIMIDD